MFTKTENTIIGTITIAANHHAITQVFLPNSLVKPANGKYNNLLESAFAQLHEYLAGQRKYFDLPLQFTGTEFQCQVWAALQTIPYGKLVSYQTIAERIGNQRAVRAVGMANHKNPLPIFVPCHRVIGKNGHLIGYAGGIELKKRLIILENPYFDL